MGVEDHDLLIRVDENVRELKETVSKGYTDHESRLRILEKEKDQLRGALKFVYAALTVLALSVAAVAASKHF